VFETKRKSVYPSKQLGRGLSLNFALYLTDVGSWEAEISYRRPEDGRIEGQWNSLSLLQVVADSEQFQREILDELDAKLRWLLP
jgi:hypothetical protein